MKKFFKDNGLSLVVGALFVLFLFGQSLAGHAVSNDERRQHGQGPETYSEYLGGGHFWQATFENWESEFLQMAAYVVFTVFLFQRGSSESKDPDKEEAVDEDPEKHKDDPNAPGPVKRGGWQLALYKYSLSLAFFGLFLLSFVGHAVGGAKQHNEELREHGEREISTMEFMGTSEFWFQSLQNWQSEFLAVLSIVVLSIWLRQQGSPESKPVHAPHDETGNG
jgi:hypothetical protein